MSKASSNPISWDIQGFDWKSRNQIENCSYDRFYCTIRGKTWYDEPSFVQGRRS